MRVGLRGAELVLDEEGLWLEVSGDRGAVEVDSLRYVRGRLTDEVVIGAATYGIPPGRGPAVRELLGAGRLRGGAATLPDPRSLLDSWSEVEAAWLRGWLGEEELLAWLETGTRVALDGLGGEEQVGWHFVLTEERAALVAIGELGDVRVEAIDEALEVVSERGRDPVKASGHEWLTARHNEAAYHAIAALPVADAAVRLRTCADLVGPNAACASILVKLGTPRARVEAAILREEVPPAAALASLEVPPGWVPTWMPANEAYLSELLAAMRSASPDAAHLMTLHEVRRARLAKGEAFARARADVDFAELLHARGDDQKARMMLRRTLDEMGSDDHLDVVPHVGEPEGERALRVQLLEALGAAGGDEVCRPLARLDPLDERRLEALSRSPAMTVRAEAARMELASPETVRDVPPMPAPLDDVERLRHPLGRRGDVLAQVKKLVAKADVPDLAALRAHCPRAESPVVTRMLEPLAKVFGVELGAFVSSGDKSVGIRGYEGSARFLLIGRDHLQEGSPHYLDEGAMRFALGAELTHLKLGHGRFTQSEVWGGALEMVQSALRLVAVAATGGLGAKVASALDVTEHGGKLVSKARQLLGAENAASEDGHLVDRELLVAHEVMQLGADRGGLVCAGDPGAAVRAIVRVFPKPGVAERVAERGLLPVLRERGEAGLAHPSLVVRIAAIIRFWLSEDYESLRG